jgi:hypothetical protein
MHATRAREETTPAYAQTRGFNQNKFEKRLYYCGIFEKKFGFYRAELERFCVLVFGMRARSLSFVGKRPRNQSIVHSTGNCRR